MKLLLSSIISIIIIFGISQAYADEAEDWCNEQSGVKDTESMNQCKAGYDSMSKESDDDEQLKKKLSTTEFEGVQTVEPQVSQSEAIEPQQTSTVRSLLIENRDLQHTIINLQNENTLLASQVLDLRTQLGMAQQIIMMQLETIMNTLADLKAN